MELATHHIEPAAFGRYLPPPVAPGATPAGRALTGLLNDALEQLSPDQVSARAKLATAIQLIGGRPEPRVRSGGLAPWQAKRLLAHIGENLDGQLRRSDAAALVRISSSHFSRAFKTTFFQPFSRYVMALRLERARVLLTTTDKPISEVALACGLADQPHLTRLFHRQYGAPPQAWRRAHRDAQALEDAA
jgi:transcriptional regulator GlxA family with amidase domain